MDAKIGCFIRPEVMQRRRFSREFKVEAVKLVRERGVSAAQAARDLDVHENVLRKWVKEFGSDPTAQYDHMPCETLETLCEGFQVGGTLGITTGERPASGAHKTSSNMRSLRASSAIISLKTSLMEGEEVSNAA